MKNKITYILSKWFIKTIANTGYRRPKTRRTRGFRRCACVVSAHNPLPNRRCSTHDCDHLAVHIIRERRRRRRRVSGRDKSDRVEGEDGFFFSRSSSRSSSTGAAPSRRLQQRRRSVKSGDASSILRTNPRAVGGNGRSGTGEGRRRAL